MHIINPYKKYLKPILFLVLFFSSLGSLKNHLQHNIRWYHGDEMYTINMGVESLYTKEVSVLRVGESTRWLARAIYPAALYYMNSNMGGEHYITGWDYPSGNYIRKHFKNPTSVKQDPNLQDFVFAMRFILGFLVIFSLAIAAYTISKNYGFVCGVAYFVLVMSSTLVDQMLGIFYTESTLIILFNLTIILALTPKINSWRLYLWSALILAFAVSTKLTGLLFLFPIIIILKTKNKLFSGLKIEGFFLLVIVLLALIHIYAISYVSVVDQTLANVYHLKTGHRHTVPSGWFQIKKMLTSLAPWIYIFPLSIFACIKYRVKQFPFIISIVLAALFILVGHINVHNFLLRNFTTPLVMILFVIAISIGALVSKINYRPSLVRYTIIGVLLIIQACTIGKRYESVTYDLISSYMEENKSVTVIGEDAGAFKNAQQLPNMPEKYTLKDIESELLKIFIPYEYVLVKRINNNKQFTNYILPQSHEIIARHGNYFVFKNKHLKGETDTKKLLLGNNKFDVYRQNRTIFIENRNCQSADLNHTFIFHVYPIFPEHVNNNIPDVFFNNLNFKASMENITGDSCFIVKKLPNYPIKALTIGQYNKDSVIWKESFMLK